MRGSGKTTLAAKAYNNQTVKQHFHCYAWITVSQAYVVDDLLRSMIKKFYPATKEAVPLDLSRLPLAITTLGGVMSTKHMESDWRKAYNNLSWELSNNLGLEAVKTILLYSFNDFPYQLKHCFLYCCLFPEDYRIRRKRLIRLWMTEGFVEKRKGLTVKEVVDSYLVDLVC
ncbi:hypothetical protein TEA_000320 [Camellia sinensis var. sinensis]|uniref:NB-ARC domain-containing protein n=1 Tax=Camellia sinensis var. sinensis TaxID=542762 RepID=A0A4S4D1W7_CAMSN|nr:hypothetical protein TEA_000320 [Camellia sinensis var. sinensis]